MAKSDYQVLATSDRHRAVLEFWRGQCVGAEEFGGNGAQVGAGRTGQRRSLAVPMRPPARRVIETIANDPHGRFAVLVAVLALAISRYFNQQGVLFRTPLLLDGGDTALNVERAVPLVVCVGRDQSLRDLLREAVSIIEDSYFFQDFPIRAVFEAGSRADLFDLPRFGLSSRQIHEVSAASFSAVHFTCDVREEAEISIDFDPALVESFLVQGLVAAIGIAIGSFEDLSRSVRQVDCVPAEQRRWLLRGATRSAKTPFVSVIELFARQVALNPGAPALAYEKTTITYRDLDRRANRLARDLSSSPDVEPFIGIWMDRSPSMVVAVLGVLKAGLGYVPIDAECPPLRLEAIVNDSGVRRLLVDEARRDQTRAFGLEPVVVDREGGQGGAVDPGVAIRPTDVAYLIYTSGSTGVPKGCVIEHQSLSNYLQWANAYYWTEPGSGNMGLFTALSFDLTVSSLFCPLLRGQLLVIYPQQMPIDELLQRQFEKGSRIEAIKLTPSHIGLLDPDRLGSTEIQLAIVGGEALTTEHVATLKALSSRMRVVNEYGPTESTVGCIAKDVSAGELITIGDPIAQTRAYVLDEELHLVPIGVRGEICVGGAGLARGYHGQPSLTADRFPPDPFVSGSRMYRTGDVGRWLPNGELECFGRLDGQVKIRGWRVELGEVEAALRACDGIQDTVVVLQSAAEDTALVAYVVSRSAVDVSTLRRNLREALPAHMVPSFFVSVEALPLTANGKVDRARLPRYTASVALRPAYATPVTAEERGLASIWEELFNLEHVGRDDDFFVLGGHSLRAMEMIRRIYRELGVDVSVGEVMSHSTVASLAVLVAGKQPSTRNPILPTAPASDYPVSHGQRSLWVLSQLDDAAAYNVAVGYDLRGDLDVEVLRQAFTAMVERHESLRTVFVETNGELRQRVIPESSVWVNYVDLRDEADGGERVEQALEEEASHVFNLARSPLLRACVFHVKTDQFVLAVTLHHIISDEWSMQVLVNELMRHYTAFRTGDVPTLDALPIHYRDYAVWEHERLSGEGLNAAQEYWLGQLGGGLPILELSTEFPRPPVQTYRGRHHYVTVDPLVGAGLRALSARHGVSVFMTLVAVVNVFLWRYSGESDIRVGTPIGGRIRDELAGQIGYFVNTLVLRNSVRREDSFADLLAGVKQTAEAAYTHQEYPFSRLVDELIVNRDLSRSPLFDVMVAYEAESEEDLSIPDLEVREIATESGVSKFDLTFTFAEMGQGFSLEIEFNTDLFSPERVERMGRHVQCLIDGVLADEMCTLAQLEMLPAEERQLLVKGFNDTAVEEPDATIVDLFDRQVRATPARAAIVFGQRVLTYCELNECANRLAHRLIAEEGVTVGSHVGVLMERSEHLVVALLAILKAGGAYVPLDPDAPADRNEFILSEAEVRTVLRSGEAGASWPSENPRRSPLPADLAYILFTSGSTGEPKGVMVEHRSVANMLRFVGRAVYRRQGRRQAACAPYTFDVSVQEIFGNLTNGNTVDLVPDDVRRDPERLLEFISTRSIDIVDCTPSFFSALLDAGLAERTDVPVVDWFTGAETLPAELLARYYDAGQHRGVRVTNFYGPTECTINATYWSTDDRRFAKQSVIPVGVPVANGRIYVLGTADQLSPVGVAGEICIGGVGVARGYLNRPKETDAAFVQDPHRPGERMYRSGDRGRWRADGQLEFLGRVDDQVKVRGFRIELGEVEIALGRYSGVRTAAVAAVPDGPTLKLVAFVVPDGAHVVVDELRRFLLTVLPAYMVPVDYLCVEGLPAGATGKVDRQRLLEDYRTRDAETSTRREVKIQGARDERRQVVLEALESVLGQGRIEVTDNFFYVGGDSIKAIQLVNRLARAGWVVRVRDVFEAPQVDQLAQRLVRQAAERVLRVVTGDVPLTPIQHWFFQSQRATLQHYNQSVLVRLTQSIDEATLRRVFMALLKQHDVLRLRFEISEAGVRQYYGEAYESVAVEDLRGLSDPVGELERRAGAVQASLNIQRGPMARFVVYRLPDADRLLAVMHHLVVDGVSWRILLADLQLALGQLQDGEAIELGAPTASFQEWSYALERCMGVAEAERSWWEEVERAAVVALPYDVRAVAGLEADARECRDTLTVEQTTALLSKVHQAYNTRTNDVLLAALARAWRVWAGPGALRVDLESHGRDGIEKIDTSRTVGWFTALYPVLLDVGPADDPAGELKAVKEILRGTPGQGLGYGLLRNGANASSVLFNFQGILDGERDGLQIAEESAGVEFGALARMSHDLDVSGWIVNQQLWLRVRYSGAQFRDDTIARFVDAYRDALGTLIAHCAGRTRPERTPSDLRYQGAAADSLLTRFGADCVEDIYPLSPLQQGMLYHSLLGGDDPVYFEQFSCTITGSLDLDAFKAAWTGVIARHSILRTTFVWTEVDEPLQVVLSDVEASWVVSESEARPLVEQAACAAAFAEEDRRRGLRLDEAPLLRFALLGFGGEAWWFFWSSHHILLDGWSSAIVLQEVFAAYQAAVTGTSYRLDSPVAFGRYIDWLTEQDAVRTAEHWRRRLRGFTVPTPLPVGAGRHADRRGVLRSERAISSATTARLAAVVRQGRITLNTLARSIWGLVLAAGSGRFDVVFGATVAGRPAELPQVEHMVGLFINTLPVRVQVEPEATWVDWLQRLQLEQADLDEDAHSSLADIQRESDVPSPLPLFESIFVFENFPVDQSLDPRLADLVVENIDVHEETNYPLTISVIPGDEVVLRLFHDVTRCDEASASVLLDRCVSLFEAFLANPQQRVEEALAVAGWSHGGRYRGELDRETAAALRRLAAKHERSMVDVAHAVAATLIARYTVYESLNCTVAGRVVDGDMLRGENPVEAWLLARNVSPPPVAPMDLRWGAYEDDGGVVLDVRCETGRFAPAWLEQVPAHVRALVRGLDGEPQTRMSGAGLMTEVERGQHLERARGRISVWRSDLSVVQLFATQVERNPDALALQCDSIELTYLELNQQANRLAHYLLERGGTGGGGAVAIWMDRSPWMVVAVLGVLKAGLAYLPIDAECPPARLGGILRDSDTRRVLCDAAKKDSIPAFSGEVIVANTLLGHDAATNDPDVSVDPASLAYIIYTSGSTGTPKGCAVEHRQLTHYVQWARSYYWPDDRGGTMGLFSPLSFDLTVTSLFCPLVRGRVLVVYPETDSTATALEAQFGPTSSVDTIKLTPSHIHLLDPVRLRGASVSLVIVGGEALTSKHVKILRAVNPAVRVVNEYGPTEATVGCLVKEVGLDQDVTIGRPIANVRAYVLDGAQKLVPDGIRGEICIAGAGVARGYHRRSELTAACFLPDPFVPGERLYRTGDIGAWRDDGELECFGRVDGQVKVRGHRIEIEEVEAVILGSTQIRAVTVVAREHRDETILIAYLVSDEKLDLLRFRRTLLESLPEYMVPTRLVPMARLPTTVNGKVDRETLPQLSDDVGSGSVVAPRSSVEQRLIAVWEQVLGVTGIGVTDDFFDLGGHSIVAVKLVAAIQRLFGRQVPLAELLAHPTVEQLAPTLVDESDASLWSPLVPIRLEGVQPPLFLLPGAGGNVIYFQALAHGLRSDRPIFGLQAIGLDGRTPPLSTVEAVAAENVGEMRRVWPEGPYLLAGHSFGGRVALEMVQQLEREGSPVALLALFDTPAPFFDPSTEVRGWEDAHWLAKIAGEIENFLSVSLHVTIADLLPLGIEEQIDFVLARLQRTGAWAAAMNREYLGGYLRVYKANMQAAHVRYSDLRRVPLVLFKAVEDEPDLETVPPGLEALLGRRAWGWESVALGPASVIEVPGDHLSMFTEPHVQSLARVLDEALEGAAELPVTTRSRVRR